MLILLMEILAGFFLGKVMKNGWLGYLVCVPVSIVVVILFKLLVQSFGGHPGPFTVAWCLLSGLFYTPIVALGLFLGRRRTRRMTFDGSTADAPRAD